MTAQTVVGTHLLIELDGCDARLLDDEALVGEALRTSALAAGATVLSVTSHAFEPTGVTAFALLAESHISIHTWPDTGYAAADVFTCGPRMRADRAVDELARRLAARSVATTTVDRGSRA